MKRLLWIVLIFALSKPSFAQDNYAPLWLDLEPGSYDVGFKVEYLLDDSRLMPSTDSLPHALEGRPIRLKIYYPGQKEISDLRMRFSDQINVVPQNAQFGTYNAILQRWDRRLQGQFGHPSADSLARILKNFTTMSYENIPEARGRFPLVIYEVGLDAHQMENSVLWEYLASHGYVVAVVPSFGKGLKERFTPYDSKGASRLSQDGLFVLNYMVDQSFVDSDKVGAIGNSFGGLVVHHMASKDKRVKAVVTLDGSINQPNAQEILNELNITSSTVNIPALNLYSKAIAPKEMSYIESLKSPVYHIGFHNASHFDFQNFPLYSVVTNVYDRRVERRRPRDEGKDIYLHVVRTTKNFLDHFFYNSNEGKRFLSALTNESNAIQKVADVRYSNY